MCKKVKDYFKKVKSDFDIGESPALGLWIILPVVIFSILFFPWLFTRNIGLPSFVGTGAIGDTINGIAGPFIATAAAILTYLAFWAQHKSNIAQTKQFERQATDVAIERFENRFFELIKLHKENLHEIIIGRNPTTEKRKAFVSMYHELQYTYWICYNKSMELKLNGQIKTSYNESQILKLAYIFFYSGIGDNSDKMSTTLNIKKDKTNYFDPILFNCVLSVLKTIRSEKRFPPIKTPNNDTVNISISYKAWGGHVSHLGHYYRHLFQTVRYVVSQDEKILNKENKLKYLKILRAQLSDYEQIMLYYNVLSGFGSKWLDDNNINYFTEYFMIHNIPLPLASISIKPEDFFKNELQKGEPIFEWLE